MYLPTVPPRRVISSANSCMGWTTNWTMYSSLSGWASNSGGTGGWAEVTRHDTGGGLGWRHREITEAGLVAAGVPPTAAMRIRFTANDATPQSVVEAGIDAFLVTRPDCAEPCPADLSGDRIVNVSDFLLLLSAWGTPDGDIDGDGDTGVADFLELLAAWGPCP